MENTKIIIEVRGGVVENVFSNQPIQYILVDHDNLDIEAEDFDLSPINPDKVQSKMSGIFYDQYKKSGWKDKRNKRLVELLNHYDF